MSSVFKDAIDQFLYPIKELLEDPGVSEIMINGPKEIFVEKKGLVYKTDAQFHNEEALLAAMRAIAQSIGRRIDKDNPRLDGFLPDGSRIVKFRPSSKKIISSKFFNLALSSSRSDSR